MSDMRNENARFVILKAFEKQLKDAIKDSHAEVKAGLYEDNDGNKTVKGVPIGNLTPTVGLYPKATKTLVGYGGEFVSFMRERGLTHEVVDDEWKNLVVVAGGKVIWKETGEVVPGAYVQIQDGAADVRVYWPTGATAQDVLFEAREAGLLDAVTLPMLEEVSSGD